MHKGKITILQNFVQSDFLYVKKGLIKSRNNHIWESRIILVYLGQLIMIDDTKQAKRFRLISFK